MGAECCSQSSNRNPDPQQRTSSLHNQQLRDDKKLHDKSTYPVITVISEPPLLLMDQVVYLI